MLIRLNLLAEAQAAAEMRRRDPVKRAIWAGAVLIVLALIWSGGVQLKVMVAHSELGRVETELSTRTNKFQQVLANEQRSEDIKGKLSALRDLSASRFLNGNLLQALQRSTVDDVQLARLRVDQAYAYAEGTKPRTNDEGHVTLGTKAKATEKILLTIEGSDTSARFDQYTKYQDTLSAYPYFKESLIKTNGVTLRSGSLTMPQIAPTGKPTVSFALECRYPDKTR